MSKKLQKFLKSFTLIELIIVIAIISVLGASAFLMLSQWMSKSRDSRKISDLSRIDTAINISFTSKDKLPTPDNKSDITFGGAKVWELGFFGDEAVNQIGGALTKTPSDPTTKVWYRYAVWNNKYQLGTIIENEQFSKYLSRTYAQSYYTKVQGNYNQSIIVAKIGTDDVIIPAPSLIVDEFTGTNYTLANEYFWSEKNNYELGKVQKNKLQVQTLFSGDISELTQPTKYEEFKTKFADIYSGTVYMKELTPDLGEEEIEEIVSAELKKVSTQNVTVQYLSCDGTTHGQTKSFYKESSVAFGESCDTHKKDFKCENGVWKDGIENGDTSIYKYLSCIEQYSITFDGNGNDGGNTDNQIIQANTTISLTNNGFTKAGNYFVGWNTQADGNGTNYEDGASFTMGTSNIRLYAKWTTERYSFISGTSPGGTSVVKDNSTGLYWQSHYSSGLAWENLARYSTPIWDDISKVYIYPNGRLKDVYPAFAYCEDLDLGGYNDWRLPTKEELEEIIDSSYLPTINSNYFNSFDDKYLTSTSDSNPMKAWFVDFKYGSYNTTYKTNLFYVRCTR